MLQLTAANVISLYAPLAGLLVVVFWLGVLTQKVTDAVRRIAGLEKAERDDHGVISDLAVLKSDYHHMKASQEQQARAMEEIKRTLSNIASGRTTITRFDQDH